MKETEKKMLAVITPRQWEQLEQIAGNSNAGNGFDSDRGYPGPEWQVLNDPDPSVRKHLALSLEQQTKLNDISAKTQAQSHELSKLVSEINSPLPAKEEKAKNANLIAKCRNEKT